MKIICSFEEFTSLVRECQKTIDKSNCLGCALFPVCGDSHLEDEVEIIVQEDGE